MEAMLTQGFIALLMALTGVVSAVFKAFKFVQEGEQGCKLRFGKVLRDANNQPIIILPGFALLIPWIETLKRRHVRQQTQRFDQQEIFIQGDLVFIVNAIVRFRVTNIYKALFEVDDLDSCINDRCMGLLRDILQDKTHDQMRDTESIALELLSKMKEMEVEWGVEFLDARLTSCAPSENSAEILSVKTSANMRTEAAIDAASKMVIKVTDAPGLLSAIVGIPVVTSASLNQTVHHSHNTTQVVQGTSD